MWVALLFYSLLHGGDTVSVDRGKMNTNSFSTFLFVFHVLLIHYFVYKRHHHWNRMERNNNNSYLLHMHMYTKIYPGNSIVQKFLFITQKIRQFSHHWNEMFHIWDNLMKLKNRKARVILNLKRCVVENCGQRFYGSPFPPIFSSLEHPCFS